MSTPSRIAPLLAVMSLSALAGCAYESETAPVSAAAAQPASVAVATLMDAAGENVGEARLVQQGDDIAVSISASGISAGPHGTHIHMTGTCDAPDFKTAGGHWNPMMTQHGLENPQGHHSGDLPNMDVQADGTGSLSFIVAGATLRDGDNPLFDEDGAAIVVHAGPDDMVSDPSGNSGGRIACGVIRSE